MKTVALVGSSTDEHLRNVAEAVASRGARPRFVFTDFFPDQAALAWEDGSAMFAGKSLDDVRSFYVKSIHLSLPLPDTDAMAQRNFASWVDRYTAERERHALLTSTLRSLATDGRTFVNPVTSFELHFLKLHQVHLLERAGVRVPSTLGTNDPKAVRAFSQRHAGVIYKPLSGGALARRLSSDDLTDERLELLGNCPALFQEEIRGREFRAYVLDGEPVGAFEVPTEGVADARELIHLARPAELPAQGWELCVKAAQALELVFTAVDLRLSPRGEFVVLECNPTPATAYYEDAKRGAVITRLAEFLVSRA